MHKVLIGIGTCDKFAYCEKYVLEAAHNQTFKDFDVLILDNSKTSTYSAILQAKYPWATVKHLGSRPKYFRDATGQSRKAVVDYAVSHGYEYLFFLDADFIIKPNTLEKLMSHNVDFVTTVVGYMHHHLNETTCFIKNHDKNIRSKIPGLPGVKALLYPEVDSLPELSEIVFCGLSCALIKVKFLYGTAFYVSHLNQSFLEDVIFIRDIRRKGAHIWLDRTLKPMHLHVGMQERQFRAEKGVKYINGQQLKVEHGRNPISKGAV